MRVRLAVLLGVLVVLMMTSCGQDRSGHNPAAPDRASLLEPSSTSGANGFCFLPPTLPVAAPECEGIFDPDLDPRIEICALDGGDPRSPDDCPGGVLVTLPGPRPAERVRVQVEEDSYLVLWGTTYLLEPRATYRAFVSVGARTLGHVDLLAAVQPPAEIPAGCALLLPGRPFTFRFRIAQSIPGALVIEPGAATIVDNGALGLGVDLAAVLTDLHGNPLPGSTLQWASGDPGLLVMDPPAGSTGGSGSAASRARLGGRVPAPTEVTVTATVGGLVATAVITVSPAPVTEQLPVAVPDAYFAFEGQFREVNAPGPLGNDFDYDGEALTLVSLGGATHGTVTNLGPHGWCEYLPYAGFTGVDTLTYVMRDASGHEALPQIIVITVLPHPNRPPVALDDSYAAFENTLLEVEAPGPLGNDFDYEGESLVLQSLSGHAHGRFTALVTNGEFAYQPDPGFVGTEIITYIMRDASRREALPGTFTIRVLPDSNRAPVAVDDAFVTLENTRLEVEAPGLLANDFDHGGEALILNSATFPAHGTLLGLVTNGRFEYQPDPGFVGTDSFTYVVHDASGHVAEPGTVTVEVLPPVGPNPFAAPDAYVAFENTLLEVEAPGPLGNDFDYEGESLVLWSLSGAAHGVFTSAVTNGEFAYRPDPGFVGTETVTYTMRDASGHEALPGTITIRVLPDPNRAPVALDDAFVTLENTLLEVEAPGPLGNDFDYEGESLVLWSLSGAAHGVFTSVVTNGEFGYRPDPGFVGTETVTYTMRDASGHEALPGTFTIRVLPEPNRPPRALGDAFRTFQGQALEIRAADVLGNDFDFEGEDLTLVSMGTPSHGSLTAMGCGQFDYRPDPGFLGTDSFTYVMRDDSGHVAEPGTVKVVVIPFGPAAAGGGRDSGAGSSSAGPPARDRRDRVVHP